MRSVFWQSSNSQRHEFSHNAHTTENWKSLSSCCLDIYMLWTLHNFSLYRLYIIIIPYFAQNIFQTKKHTNGLLFYIIWGKGEKIKRNLGVYRENIEKCSTTIYIQIVDRYFMQCICKAISFYLSDAKNSCLWLFRVNGGIRQMRYN